MRFRLLAIAGVLSLLFHATLAPFDPRVHAQGTILWLADHEEPSDADWYFPGGLLSGGGQYASGCTSVAGAGMGGASFVRWEDAGIAPLPGGGDFGLTLAAVNTCGGPEHATTYGAGTRMFRWKESVWDFANQPLTYKVWFYIPQHYTLTGSVDWWFWNIWQWKSKTETQNDVFFSVNIYNRLEGGNMYLQLRDAQAGVNPDALANLDVPVNQWFYIEGYYDSQEDPTGRVKIWQGDAEQRTLLWDIAGVSTRFVGGDVQWSVNNYTSGLTPQPAYFFIDNAEIRTAGAP
jgi:hypothetical protein